MVVVLINDSMVMIMTPPAEQRVARCYDGPCEGEYEALLDKHCDGVMRPCLYNDLGPT